MEKVGFGLIGCGFIGQLHAGVISCLPHAALVACCDSNEEAGRAMAEKFGCRYYTSYAAMLEDGDIDAITICLPSGMHSHATIAAAQAGKHILCEKPIDISVASAQAMVDAAQNNGVKFGVIMQHRFDAPMLLLRQALQDGTLGHVLWGASRTLWYRDDSYFKNPWRGTWQVDGGGALINQSVHYIDLLLSIFGDVQSVSAKCRKLLHHQIEAEDVGIANLEFANGCLGTIEGTTAAYPGHYAELAVFCENGSVIIRNDELLSYQLKSGKDPAFEAILNPEKANLLNESPAIPDDSHRKQYEDFVAAVREDRPPLVTGADALKSLRVIQAIYTASREKREVYL
ncbi:MAG: Gfo/Idh/MocA family oxidoreductase [Gemmiger sp.]|nr:Gfo/Idh/MocA family oxidoreductase [Gemmiger sp.]